MVLPKPTHSFVNLPAKPVFVPIECYVSALKLSLELALELRLRCDEEIHRSQIEEIDAALVEVGEGRASLQSVADRARLVEIRPSSFIRYMWNDCHRGLVATRRWDCQNVRVTKREYDAVGLGDSVQTRGILAVATMKTHQYRGGYFVRLDFKERAEA